VTDPEAFTAAFAGVMPNSCSSRVIIAEGDYNRARGVGAAPKLSQLILIFE